MQGDCRDYAGREIDSFLELGQIKRKSQGNADDST